MPLRSALEFRRYGRSPSSCHMPIRRNPASHLGHRPKKVLTVSCRPDGLPSDQIGPARVGYIDRCAQRPRRRRSGRARKLDILRKLRRELLKKGYAGDARGLAQITLTPLHTCLADHIRDRIPTISRCVRAGVGKVSTPRYGWTPGGLTRSVSSLRPVPRG